MYLQDDDFQMKGYIASVDVSSLSEDMSVFDGNVGKSFSSSTLQYNPGKINLLFYW